MQNMDHDLPKSVFFKHGAYYKVIKNKWIRLGATLEEAREALPGCANRAPTQKHEALTLLLRKFAATRQNARARGIEFQLERADVEPMLASARWRCAVTGKSFSAEVINGKRPFLPSIDRIDSTKGYTRDNCRVVCVAANIAMNVWGEQVLRALLRRRKGASLDVQ